MRIEPAPRTWSRWTRIAGLLAPRHGGSRWPRAVVRTGFAIAVIFAYEWFQWW
jgi:hypothetical protein